MEPTRPLLEINMEASLNFFEVQMQSKKETSLEILHPHRRNTVSTDWIGPTRQGARRKRLFWAGDGRGQFDRPTGRYFRGWDVI
jgi:hypothetical protein